MNEEKKFIWTDDDQQLLERVQSFMNESETINAYAKRCGLDPANLRRFFYKTNHLGPIYCRRIATVMGVNFTWLTTGKGKKKADAPVILEPVPYATLSNETSGITAGEIEILKAENDTLHKTLDVVVEMNKIVRDTLEQNKEALAQNRELINMLIEMKKGSN